MKRLENIYPVDIFGHEIYVAFDHFTPNGAAVYNVEFIALTYNNYPYLVRYKGIIAANREYAARIALDNFNKADK